MYYNEVRNRYICKVNNNNTNNLNVMKTATKYKRLTELKPEIITDKDITKYLFAKSKGFYRYSCKRNAQNKPDKRIDIVGRFVFISNTVKQYYSIDKRYFFNHWDEYQSDCYAFIDYYHRRILIRCRDDAEFRKVQPIVNRAHESDFTMYITPYEIKLEDISSTGEVINYWIFLHIDYLAKKFIESTYTSIYRILNYTYNEYDINRNHILVLQNHHIDNPYLQNIIQLCQKNKIACSLRYNKVDPNRKVTVRINNKMYIQVLLPSIVDIINNNILNKTCCDYITRFVDYHNSYKTDIKFEFYNDYVGTRGADYFALDNDYTIFNKSAGLKHHIRRKYNIIINKPEFTNITIGCANVEDSFKRIVDYIDNKIKENGRD